MTQDRDLFVDTLRGLAVLVVVFGHWLAASVVEVEGTITGLNALTDVPESHLATWLLQVMPLLFFVGGFANARSLVLHDGSYLGFVRTRMIRILTPTLAFLLVWTAVGLAAQLLPLGEPNLAAHVADIASLPFWFLGVYLIVISLAPWLWSLHERFGWKVPGFMVGGAIVVDGLVHGVGIEQVGVFNFAFVWLLSHQLGYLYAAGRLDRVKGWKAVGWAGVGLAGLIGLSTSAGYPVSLIAVPGADRFNTNPPSLMISAVTVWLVGLALLARGRIGPWAEKRVEWVRRINRVPLTLYLWHVSAVAIGAVLWLRLGWPQPDIGSTDWWLLRVPWFLVIIPFQVVMVWVMGRFEVHPEPVEVTMPEQRTRHLAIGLATVSVALGMFGYGVTGFDNPATHLGGKVIIFSMNPLQNILHVLIGVGLFLLVYRARLVGLWVLGVAVTYLAVGVAGWSEGIRWLAMNPEGAVFHLVLGGLVMVLLGLAWRGGANDPTRPVVDQ